VKSVHELKLRAIPNAIRRKMPLPNDTVCPNSSIDPPFGRTPVYVMRVSK
jgi:hypothetical protein